MAVTTDTIRLYTEAPEEERWEYYAKKHGDPHFSTFLSGLEESTGTLPDELLLEGSLADMMNEGWREYTYLYAGSQIVEATLEAKRQTKQYIRDALPSPSQLVLLHTFPASLRALRHIIHVVDTPKHWQVYALAEEHDNTEEEIADHLIATGRALIEMGLDMRRVVQLMPLRISLGTKSEEEYNVLRMLHSIAYHSSNPSEEEKKYEENVDTILIGLIHHGLLFHRYHSNCTIGMSLYDLPWHIVPLMLKKLGIESVPDRYVRGQYPSLNTLTTLLLGKGDALSTSWSIFSWHEKTIGEGYTIPSINVASGISLAKLYQAIWDSTPEDVDPNTVGLWSILGTNTRTNSTTSVVRILCAIHNSIAENLRRHYKYESLGLNVFQMLVVLYAESVVSIQGLKRIALSLSKNISKYDSATGVRMAHFASCAEHYIGKVDTVVSSDDFPMPDRMHCVASDAHRIFKDYHGCTVL